MKENERKKGRDGKGGSARSRDGENGRMKKFVELSLENSLPKPVVKAVDQTKSRRPPRRRRPNTRVTKKNRRWRKRRGGNQ